MNILEIYTKYPKVITDSRKACPDSIFFALKGESFDGNDFAALALDLGCNYAVVDRAGVNPAPTSDNRYILVDDVLSTLQDLAREFRKQLNIPVLGITGSNGKTTTKELIKCVLGAKYETYATAGNYNNHIGVPLTILDIPSHTEIAIIEMGANHKGEIKILCDIAQPTCGLITNIGKAHLEGFGGLEGVKKAKKELYDYLNENLGVIFYNEKNPILTEMLENVCRDAMHCVSTKTIGYQQIVKYNVISASPFLNVELYIGEAKYMVSTQLAGIYNLENIIAATCVGVFFDVPSEKIVSAIESYKPQNNRSQTLRTTRNQLLLDYYNANPTSMSMALSNFFEQVQGEKMVILGDMFELGEYAPQEHASIVKALLQQPNSINIVVGKHFYEAAKDFPQIQSYTEIEELKKWLAANPPSNKFVLLKGSRGMKLEQLMEYL